MDLRYHFIRAVESGGAFFKALATAAM